MVTPREVCATYIFLCWHVGMPSSDTLCIFILSHILVIKFAPFLSVRPGTVACLIGVYNVCVWGDI